MPSSLRSFIRRWLRGGWLDDARLRVQAPVFARLLGPDQLTGVCLNAGCGDGLFAPFLDAQRGLTRIVHMDLGRPAVAARFAPGRHEDHTGSLTALPFPDGAFTAALCTEVLEHIEDDALACGELARVLQPGGLLLVSVPTPPAPPDPAHVREGYTLADLTTRLHDAGFDVLRHTWCFHLAMRLLTHVWRWQFRVVGRGRRSVMPRAMVVAAGHLDRRWPMGRPWDLVVLARRR